MTRSKSNATIRHVPQMVGSTYRHRDSQPFSEIDRRSPCERGQLRVLDGECGGWCAS